MPALIRVGDDTTEAEIIECMSHLPRTEWDAERETRIDTLWAEVLTRRGGAHG